MIYREKNFGPTLCHFNPNHDPRNGQFAKGSSGISSGRLSSSRLSKKTKQIIGGAAIGAGVSIAASMINFAAADSLMRSESQGAFRASKLSAVAPTIIKAGKVAIVSALGVAGGQKISELHKERLKQHR